jgi:FdhE protein
MEHGTRDLRAFIAEALLQPFAEVVARRFPLHDTPADPPARCPVCGDVPVVTVLRDEAHGAKRSFVSGFCLTEWQASRIGCPGCGEHQFDKLAVYRADEFPGARIDACDSCRAYLKTIDLTKDATAVPVVDDIATLSLDVWAREQGYTRLRPNLLRL